MDYGIVHSKAKKTKVIKVEPDIIQVERYYENGQLKFKGDYSQMPETLRDEPVGRKIICEEPFEFVTESYTKEGVSTWYHDNGQIFKRVYNRKGKEDGPMEIYHANGQLMEQGEIVMGARVGTWKYYNLQGRLYKKDRYHADGSGSTEEVL